VKTLNYDLQTDNTERRRWEEQLKLKHEQLDILTDHLPVMVGYVDADQKFMYVNKAYADWYGLNKLEIIGKQLKDIVSPASYKGLIIAYNRVMKGEKLIFENVAFDRAGNEQTVRATYLPHISDAGEVIAFVGMIENVTNQKKSELELIEKSKKIARQNEEYQIINEEYQTLNAELQKNLNEMSQLNAELISARKRAENADKLKSEFLANMSHEIRTPLNAILGFTDLIKMQNQLRDDGILYANIVQQKGKELLNLIEDIINLSKIEADQIELSINQCCLNDVMSDLFITYQNTINNAKGHELKLFITDKLPHDHSVVLTDEFRLKQIMNNLLSNAIKFTKKGAINYGVTRKDTDTLLFYVQDTGIGIANDKLDVIFQRFRQADSSATRKFGGTGLGLTIAKGLVELLGGKIWVVSTLGKGATFYFTVPYKRAAIEQLKVRNVAEPDNLSLKKLSDFKILIVEDDEVSALMLSEMLKRTHAEIIKVSNGKQAVDFCKSNPVDIIFMDMQLPKMNGYEATRLIRTFNNKVFIIAQTAEALQGSEQNCYDAGCDAYISKPIEFEKLVNIINSLLL